MHSYNHRRAGPDGAPTPAAAGAGRQYRHLLDAARTLGPRTARRLTDTVESFDYRGRRLDVRRTLPSRASGALARFVHTHFAHTGCAIALEVKKFFMDEWTGVPYRQDIAALQGLLAALVPALRTALARVGPRLSNDANGMTLAPDALEEHMLSRVLRRCPARRPFRVISSGGNRVHVDRDLPFMCACLRGVSPPPSLARRVAASSAIHLLWSRVDEDDTEPERSSTRSAGCMKQQYDGLPAGGDQGPAGGAGGRPRFTAAAGVPIRHRGHRSGAGDGRA